MSRNFDLIHEMERDKALHSNRVVEPIFPFDGEERNTEAYGRLTDESALTLVQRVFPLQTQEPPRMVVFAGIDQGNGCSKIAVSVAEILARNAPGGVCLVEANFRSPALPRMLGTTNYHGLTDALLEEDPIRAFVKPVSSEGLWLLSSGPLSSDSPNLLTSQRMKVRAAELRNAFDFVIVDAPAMTQYADAISLGQLSDGIVLVLEAGSTRREAALMAVENLRSSKVHILGAVLNNQTSPIPKKIYSWL